jgi:hypothetical protein
MAKVRKNGTAAAFIVEELTASGGMLAGVESLSLGDELRMSLQLVGVPSIEARAMVVREEEAIGRNRYAIRFTEISLDSVDLIRKLLGQSL